MLCAINMLIELIYQFALTEQALYGLGVLKGKRKRAVMRRNTIVR